MENEGSEARLEGQGEAISDKAPNTLKTTLQSFGELLRFTLTVLVVVILVRVFIIEPFVVSGSSMVPTFHNGDYLVVDKISYRLGEPKRFDVIIFQYPRDPEKYFIKRVIGLPNETVDIKGSVITIINGEHPEGFELDQSFIKNPVKDNIHYELKSQEYFVMGDNRGASSDSRIWGGVPRANIAGKALLRLMPIEDLGVLPGYYKPKE